MKTLIAALLLSTSTMAHEMNAVDALYSILSPSQYTGQTPEGQACMINFAYLGVEISASGYLGQKQITVSIPRDGEYRWNPGQRMFLFSNAAGTFRTVAVEDNSQYIVVADRNDDKIECIVNL